MTSSSPYFSVVIPTYNREGFIKRTISSLLSQDFVDFEIIVVDDGSTDNTEAVIGTIIDPRLSYYKIINGERGAARNYGAKQARGHYINFFDSDDFAYPQHLKTAENVINKLEHPEVFHMGYDVRNEQGKLESIHNHFSLTINASLINGNHLSPNCVFIRRDIALAHRFNEDRVLATSEDYELWLRLSSRFNFYSNKAVTTSLLNHRNRSVLLIDSTKLTRRIDALIHYLMNDSKFTDCYGGRVKLFRAYLNIYIALHLAMAKAPFKESQRYLLKAIRLHPPAIFTWRFLSALRKTLM